jgi:hypothetical protein
MVSPILSTILLDKLDQFVERVLIPQYTPGETRKLNPDYRKLQSQMRTLFAKGQKEAALTIRKRMQKLPSIHPRDPDWRRLKYIRYADDFGLAFTGPQSEAEAIKRAVSTFLRQELGLMLDDNSKCRRIASRKNLTLRGEHASWKILLCSGFSESLTHERWVIDSENILLSNPATRQV